MANYEVSVTKNGLVPATLYLGTEGSAGHSITFSFSADWDDFTKEVLFFDTRGNVIVTPVGDAVEIPVPDELAMYGGPHKFTVRGFTLDDGLYIDDQLQVTGTIVTTYTAGHNPRLEGRILPSTLDLFLYKAEQEMNLILQNAKDSGLFDGADGVNGQNGAAGTPAGFGTPVATAHSLSQDDTPTVSIAASGSDVAKVFTFDFGIPVSVGKNFTILGHYASLEALQAAVPNPEAGDAYSVGDSFYVYVWDPLAGTWDNYGTIGSGGSPITVDTSMSDSSTNAVQNKIIKAYVDDSIPSIPTALKNPYSLTIFGSAYDGSSAVTVTMDSAMSDSSANAVQNQVIKAYVDGLIGDIDTAITAINALIGTPSE